MNYGSLARIYHLLERFSMGRALQVARIGQLENLSRLTEPRRVLIIGEGNGCFLLEFVKRFPQAEITVVESCAAMVAEAKTRLEQSGRPPESVQWVVKSFLEVELPSQKFDCIVTLFFLDNFQEHEVVQCIDKINTLVEPEARWLVSDFCLPDRCFLKLRARLWLWMLYRFFRWKAQIPAKELPAIEQLIQSNCVSREDRKTNCGDLLFSSLYRFR